MFSIICFSNIISSEANSRSCPGIISRHHKKILSNSLIFLPIRHETVPKAPLFLQSFEYQIDCRVRHRPYEYVIYQKVVILITGLRFACRPRSSGSISSIRRCANTGSRGSQERFQASGRTLFPDRNWGATFDNLFGSNVINIVLRVRRACFWYKHFQDSESHLIGEAEDHPHL